MPRTSPEAALLVFTKAPQPGAVKTRLVPLLGAEGAATLQQMLIEHTLETAREAALGALELHVAPDCSDAFLQACAKRYDARLAAQASGDLGVRMARALEQALAVRRFAVLIGADCPVLGARHLRAARDALCRGADAVLAPTEDGGYALLGVARHDPALFRAIDWGTERVMTQTRARLSELGWRWHELETLWDVDRPEDYRRLQALTWWRLKRSDSPAETGS